MDDIFWMRQAIALAEKAKSQNEVPVGALIVENNKLIATGYNCPISTVDTLAHAEMQAIKMACKVLNNYRLTDTTLFVTLEPCVMCAGAIIHARIQRVVYGAQDKRVGAQSVFDLFQNKQFNHRVDTTAAILEAECADLLKQFFKEKRERQC